MSVSVDGVGGRAGLPQGRARWQALMPLFLISLTAVGYEIALTRYFAVAKWSEYGYWVISIVMVGFALSGVVLALFRDAFERQAARLFAVLPALLIATATGGFHLTTTNPFNPLQLQNQATWIPQLWNIAGYYACLLPFFFLTGVFVSLSFVRHSGEIGRVYAFDLAGAGIGALLVLGLMAVAPPFLLVPLLLVPLAGSALFGPAAGRGLRVALAAVALLAGEALLLLDSQAEFNDFKAIYAPLHTQDSRVVGEIRSPRGYYLLLDDFTERVDTDVSNNAGMLGLPGPPTTLGLYRDGNRIASLPKPGPIDVGYAPAGLDALPYLLRPEARVLLAGASGGFRVAAVRSLGASHVTVLEPEAVLRDALRYGLGPSPAMAPDPAVTVSGDSPLATVRAGTAGGGAGFDVIDLSGDFLDAAEANATAFTADAITAYLRALAPGGIISIPVSIRDFPVYATRMLATVRTALLDAGIDDPAAHVIVYRSAWNVRILLSPERWDAERIAAVKAFANDRSFDVSYYPGIDIVAARADIYNDLPVVSFDAGEVETSTEAHDAIADEALAVLSGASSPSQEAFNLAPVTLERPFFYAVLRLEHLDTVLKRLEILPQAEIGALVNLAVLAQAVVIAVLVLLVPLLAPGRVRPAERSGGLLRGMIYFPALGLGFLFLEIFLIEKASLYLNDRTTAFALVLTGMLIFSGIGSMASARFSTDPRHGIGLAIAVVLAWCLLVAVGLQPALLGSLTLPFAVRAVLLIVLIAPLSLALGLPFPLGLERAGSGGFLPWAWGLNGAFSVVATPLANLIAREAGFSRVLLAASLLYAVAYVTFPIARKSIKWQHLSEASRVAD